MLKNFKSLNLSSHRLFSNSNKALQKQVVSSKQSLLGDISGDSEEIQEVLKTADTTKRVIIPYKEDPQYQKYREALYVGKTKRDDLKKLRIPILPPKPVVEMKGVVSPLKAILYKKNVEEHGFFKFDKEITHEGRVYKVNFTPEELEALEPSVYVESYRIKSSLKKAYLFLSFLSHKDYSRNNAGANINWKLIEYRNRNNEFKFTVEEAITQLQFQKKKLGKVTADLLKRGLENGEALNIPKEKLYLDKIWVGNDGGRQKQIDIKGRGRRGILEHNWIHIKCILKNSDISLKRMKYEQDVRQFKRLELKTKPTLLRGPASGVYKW
ncbi:hypothetical protein ACO0OL_003577 [Hanseniaspora opuntiae]|jgi:ribosomal protein L22|uniref:54S ribosomal protein L22, mitochondrial n=1 Tax=Hanseniaspora opuntiae TaxID=211096 RepID=A0A1E5RLZ5_9ASCO|nr:54S ribosomal protein L22, mitochondrial [Hanseniaspora opuntiae]